MREEKIVLPQVNLPFPSYKEDWIIQEEITVSFDEVIVEKNIEEIRPDILIMFKGAPLIIEIKVTHGVEENKLNKIKELNISALEIDLSQIDRDIDFDKLVDIIVNGTKQKKWLIHRKQESVYSNLLQYSEYRHSIQRGFANHIDNCPIKARVWKGKAYANMIDDCWYCKYCIEVSDSRNSIRCSGSSRMTSMRIYYQ